MGYTIDEGAQVGHVHLKVTPEGEIQLYTRPLDLAGLLREAAA